MLTLASSEVPDEMQHDMASHQGLHCLTRYIDLTERDAFLGEYNHR